MSGRPAEGKEDQAKFCHERAVHVEKHFGAVCQTLGSITRKIAKLRDKGDILSKQLLEFADKENISHSTCKNLKDFAYSLAVIQDYRHAEIARLENKVVIPLSFYGLKCKNIKKMVKTEQASINREMKRRKTLEKVRSKKPGDAHSISAAEIELQKAMSDASSENQALHKHMTLFEKEKLTDLKRILADFVSIEMAFHAKAIEHYSQCFESLTMVDEEMDLEEFTRKLNLSRGLVPAMFPLETDIPLGTLTSMASTNISSTLGSSSEYTSTGGSYTYTCGDSTLSSSEKRVRIQAASQSMYTDDDEDDDDNDESDDEDD